MMLLSNGTVLAHNEDWVQVNPTAWYPLTPGQPGATPGLDKSYINGAWGPASNMNVGREYFPSAVLPNGNLFVLGGEFSGPQSLQNFATSGEIYNPTSGPNGGWQPGWTSTLPDPVAQFGDDPIEVLPDGTVLCGDLSDNKTEIYHPATDTWTAGPTKKYQDQSDEETWVKLPDGSILTYDIFASAAANTFLAERFIPATATQAAHWVDASNVNPANPPTQLSNRTTVLAGTSAELGGAVLLPNGNVFITGNTGVTGNTALYNWLTNTWSAGPDVPNSVAGGDLPMAMMPNGDVLIAEWGSPFPSAGIHLWEYNPSATSAPATPRCPPHPPSRPSTIPICSCFRPDRC